jgi:transcription antitermination factor NusG
MNTLQPWFALLTKPRSEKKVDYLLRQKGYECFTPTYQQKRKWSDRTVEVDSPLFPRYVFCRLSSSVFGKAVTTPGVIKIVGFGGKPAEITVDEIDALRLLVQSHFLREPWKYIPNGTPVRVETGPLAGVQGIVCQEDKKRRLIISVTLLQRSVAVQLDEGTVVSVVSGFWSDPKKGQPSFSTESDLTLSLLRK